MIVSDFKRGKIKLHGTATEISKDLAYAICEYKKALLEVGASGTSAEELIRELTDKALSVGSATSDTRFRPPQKEDSQVALEKYKKLWPTAKE